MTQKISSSLNIQYGVTTPQVTSSFTIPNFPNFVGTASWSTNSNRATTASFVSALNQNVQMTGSLQVSGSLVVFTNLPTSPVGLPTGAIWNNGGVLNIV